MNIGIISWNKNRKKCCKIILLCFSFLLLNIMVLMQKQKNPILRVETDGEKLYFFYILDKTYGNSEQIVIEHWKNPQTEEFWLFLPQFCSEENFEECSIEAFGMEKFRFDDTEIIPGGGYK